jgi:hypothetical protein
MASNTTVVCFSGAGRSGTTLLARLLGEVEGFVNIGEATAFAIDPRYEARNIPCGCGEGLQECSFWRPVVSRIDTAAREAAANLVRFRSYPVILAPSRPPTVEHTLDRLAGSLDGMFKAITDQSGCRIIVDSTKSPASTHILSRIEDIDLRIVHVVRDPRGFVSSRARPKAYLNRIPPLKATTVWMMHNLAAESLSLKDLTCRRVRYEDFVTHPERTVSSLVEWIAGKRLPLSFLDDGSAQLGPQHIIGGNPDKLASGRLEIRYRPWQLTPPVRLMVSCLTWPLATRYGYTFLGEPRGVATE